jgi:hypothetical protein
LNASMKAFCWGLPGAMWCQPANPGRFKVTVVSNLRFGFPYLKKAPCVGAGSCGNGFDQNAPGGA